MRRAGGEVVDREVKAAIVAISERATRQELDVEHVRHVQGVVGVARAELRGGDLVVADQDLHHPAVAGASGLDGKSILVTLLTPLAA